MHGRPSFRRLLMAIHDAFGNRREDVEKEAANLMHALGHAEGLLGRNADFSPAIVEHMVQAALGAFDRVNGGFGHAPKFPHPAVLDLLLDWYARTGEEQVLKIVTTTLEKMARGGVFDQIAGGFHRYSVDERWCVPHFEKMSYDNSELLKNYAHAYQVTGNPFFAHVARGIIRWMSEWLSDRERGGFYASQDADISMHDDGDHFTWTRDEAAAILSPSEFEVAALHYDIGETGEMHHDPKRNVLWVSADIEEVAKQIEKPVEEVQALLDSAREKMYAERKRRPVPFIDRTIYTSWNSLCVSAFLQAARAIGTAAEGIADSSMEDAYHFALRSLDRALSEAWKPERGLSHVIAYGEKGSSGAVPGMLDDYAFTALACLDAFEASSDLVYLRFARQITDAMIKRFYDETGGGFFDTESASDAIGALAAKRKPFQDSPTPAGDPAAAIALLRLHALAGEEKYRELAKDTLELFAGVAEQFGIYAGTYGIAAVWMAKPHTQAIVTGKGALAEELYASACRPFALNKTALRVVDNETTAAYLPQALAEPVANLPGVKEGAEVAIVCSNFACQRPSQDPEALEQLVRNLIRKPA
jgi:uncharacterized protein YyaL (SSP411 family)